jgi:hypothetical protein
MKKETDKIEKPSSPNPAYRMVRYEKMKNYYFNGACLFTREGNIWAASVCFDYYKRARHGEEEARTNWMYVLSTVKEVER